MPSECGEGDRDGPPLSPVAQTKSPVRRQVSTLGWLLVVLVVAAGLRLHRLTEVSYWFDEGFCLRMADFPLFEMLGRATEDPHPPFFYLLLKVWIGVFGDSPVAARLLGVVCGLSAVVGIFLFVREAYRQDDGDGQNFPGTYAAVLAAALVALSPSHIHWSLLIRMYALGTALAAFSSYFLMRALRRNSKRRDWACFTATAILLAYTHYFGLFTVAALYCYAFGHAGLSRHAGDSSSVVERMRPVVISAGCFYVAWLPWLIPFLDHRQLVDEKFRIPPLTFRMFAATLYSSLDLQLWRSFSRGAGLLIVQAWFVVVVGTLLGRRPADYYLALAASLPVLAALVVSLLMRHIFVQRYFLFVQMFAITCVAVLVARIPWKGVRIVVSLLVVGGMSVLTGQEYSKRERDAQLPGMQGAIAYLDSQRQPTEPLIVCNPMLFVPLVACTPDRQAIYTTGSRKNYPFYQGTAVTRDEEYFSGQNLRDFEGNSFWTFDAERWFNHTWTVAVPSGWKETREVRFPEFNAVFVLRRYSREGSAETHQK